MKLKALGLFIFSIAFSTVLAFAETSEAPREDKKEKTSVSNFTETQKTKNQSESFRALEVDHGLHKRSAEIYPEEEDKKQEFNDPKNVGKRTRLGFTGMRGKKEFSSDDCAKNARARLEGALNKRFYRSFNELFGGKRAALAFHGMRGKKSDDYDNEILDSEGYDAAPQQEFLISSGLMDDPGETAEFLSEKRSEDESASEEGLSKRSPYAFQGMRGKKESAYDLKRAMGFLGMRGKKATEVWDSDASYKRAPQTSFFGMKGKKAQSSGFFGMRGKKASPNAFFGIKGKREPLGFDFQDFSFLNQMNESGPSRNRFRRGITWLNNSKKAKNAFFGIRGKKSTQETPSTELNPRKNKQAQDPVSKLRSNSLEI